jgi:hypothetical protein
VERGSKFGNLVRGVEVTSCRVDYPTNRRKVEKVSVVAVAFRADGFGTHGHPAVFGQEATAIASNQARTNPLGEWQESPRTSRCGVGSGSNVRNGRYDGIAVDKWTKA